MWTNSELGSDKGMENERGTNSESYLALGRFGYHLQIRPTPRRDCHQRVQFLRKQQRLMRASRICSKTFKPSWCSSSSRESRGIARKGQQRIHGNIRGVTVSCLCSPIELPLSLDPLDLQLAATQASRHMARSVQTCRWQAVPSVVTTFTDSDRAGDRSSRESTSGGVVYLGHLLTKSWHSQVARRSCVPSSRVSVSQQAPFRCSWLLIRSSVERLAQMHLRQNLNLISKRLRPHSLLGRSVRLDF